MPLFTASLNSGSNGNCYYVGNSQEAVLVDAGISCRETLKRMTRLGLHISKVKAIFISHEHSDHIRGVEVLSKKYALPVYITSATLRNSGLQIDPSLVRSFSAFTAINVGGLSITAFPKLHDAIDPHSFIVSGEGVNIGVLTDIGAACTNVIRYFSECHAAYLEANYDVDMLEKGNYPYHLKRRIRSGRGHLSNHQALQLFNAHKAAHLSHVFLSHLSRDNNDPFLALDTFAEHAGTTNVSVASRFEETPVFCIDSAESLSVRRVQTLRASVLQMSLFQD